MLPTLRRLLAKRPAPLPPSGFAEVSRERALPPAIAARLAQMYDGARQRGSDGQLHPLDPHVRVEPAQGAVLHELHARIAPVLSVEIGMAYGFSTLWFLAAMQARPGSRHVAIDPFQHSHWSGIGWTNVVELGLTDRCELIDAPSSEALVDLARRDARAQLVFIDGDHRFDFVLADFALSTRICDMGGVIVFDDLWMPASQRTVEFVERNREDFRREPSPSERLAIFRRVRAADERAWDHFVDFAPQATPRGLRALAASATGARRDAPDPPRRG